MNRPLTGLTEHMRSWSDHRGVPQSKKEVINLHCLNKKHEFDKEGACTDRFLFLSNSKRCMQKSRHVSDGDEYLDVLTKTILKSTL